MADGGREDVLGQKARAALRAFEARGMSPGKALRRALSRCADSLWGLALVTQNVSLEEMDQDKVASSLSDTALLILLDGPDGAIGLVAIERDVMTGLTEIQTIQQVSTIPFDPERVLTSTDAAMMVPVVDGTLERMVEYLADHPLHGEIAGFRFGAMVEDARTAALVLDAHGYRCFQAQVDLALGRRRGAVSFYLPMRPVRHGTTSGGINPPGPGPHEELLNRVPARLEAILTRLTLPLGQAEKLAPGDVLKLPLDVLSKVEVSAGRQVVTRGTLGQSNGLRAVRLTPPASQAPESHGADASDPHVPVGLVAPAPEPELPEVSDFPMIAEPEITPPPEDSFPALPPETGESEELPQIDFAADAADFDMGEFDVSANEGGDDLGLDSGFAAAPLDFDFEDQ